MKVRVPARFQEATIASLSKSQFPSVISYAENIEKNVAMGRGILLSGPTGVGKTWAIAALTRAYVEAKDRPGHEFATAPDMFDRLNEMASEEVTWDEYRGKPWVQTYNTVPWLVINDLGKEYRGGKLGDQVAYKLGRVLRARSERRLVTHITTNMNGMDAKKAYGESVSSLMAETLNMFSIRGDDRRRA